MRYKDYAKDNLTTEIEDAATNTEARQTQEPEGFDMPAQFVGKSAEEVAKSFIELQSLNGRQANELGSVRQELDILQSNDLRPTEEPVEPAPPVTVDDLYEDADGAIGRVVAQHTNSRIEVLERKLQESETSNKVTELGVKHPNWRDTAQTKEFKDWVGASAYRGRLARDADKFDFDAADALFGMYNDLTGGEQSQGDALVRDQQLRDATLETSNSSFTGEDNGEFSRENLTQARIMAKKGNENARRWLKANSLAITKAYQEGHIID